MNSTGLFNSRSFTYQRIKNTLAIGLLLFATLGLLSACAGPTTIEHYDPSAHLPRIRITSDRPLPPYVAVTSATQYRQTSWNTEEGRKPDSAFPTIWTQIGSAELALELYPWQAVESIRPRIGGRYTFTYRMSKGLIVYYTPASSRYSLELKGGRENWSEGLLRGEFCFVPKKHIRPGYLNAPTYYSGNTPVNGFCMGQAPSSVSYRLAPFPEGCVRIPFIMRGVRPKHLFADGASSGEVINIVYGFKHATMEFPEGLPEGVKIAFVKPVGER